MFIANWWCFEWFLEIFSDFLVSSKDRQKLYTALAGLVIRKAAAVESLFLKKTLSGGDYEVKKFSILPILKNLSNWVRKLTKYQIREKNFIRCLSPCLYFCVLQFHRVFYSIKTSVACLSSFYASDTWKTKKSRTLCHNTMHQSRYTIPTVVGVQVPSHRRRCNTIPSPYTRILSSDAISSRMYRSSWRTVLWHEIIPVAYNVDESKICGNSALIVKIRNSRTKPGN